MKKILGAKYVVAAALAVMLMPHAAMAADDATAVLKRAAAAMGEPKTLRYVAEGTGYTFGQAFVPGAAWPKITVHSQIRTINYDTGSMREEITLSRAEPRGGGGYPLSGQQRNDQFVSGQHAWNMAGTNPQPGARFVNDRTHQLWVTPHGALRAALRNRATVKFHTRGGKSVAAVSFTEPGRFAATLFLDGEYLVERVESRLPDPVMGDVASVASYSEYRDTGGVKFPSRIRMSQGGHPTLEVTVKEVQPNAPADISVPDAVANASERVTADRVADGVWFIAGGSHNSVAIEMKDHMVLVETPLFDGRSDPVLAEVKKLGNGKPIRYVVNSHHHFDHSGGLRSAVGAGATLVVSAVAKPYFERVFANPNRISPDSMAKSGKKAKVIAFATGKNAKKVFSDGSRSFEIHSIADAGHAEGFNMVYLPKEKLLIEADGFTPPPPNAPVPATPNSNSVNLAENIERLKLDVDRILPLHGRVVPLADLKRFIGGK